MAGWSCARTYRSPGAEEFGDAVLCDNRVCFFLWSEKQKQLFCPPLSKEELDSCRTWTSLERHLHFFSFLHCPVILYYRGWEGIKLQGRETFTICWRGNLPYPFLQQNGQVHGHRCRMDKCGLLLLGSNGPCGLWIQCWLWIQGEIGFSVGSAASLTSNDVVLCTLTAPAVITCAGKYAYLGFGYPSAYRFQLYKCLSSSSLQPFYPDKNKYSLIPWRERSVRSTMKKAVHRLLWLCANTLRFRDRQKLNKTKKPTGE